jgi:hypothetical protein
MDFIADFFTFLWASITNLIALLSGVVGLVIDWVRRRYGWDVPNDWYVWIIVVCLMLGMFSAWREEHSKVVQQTQANFSQQYVQVNKGGAIVKKENFDEYGMRVERRDIEGKPRYSLGQTEYLLTFEKEPVRIRVETQEGTPVKVEPLDPNTPNVRRVRCMQAGAGGSISVECNFTVEAFRK